MPKKNRDLEVTYSDGSMVVYQNVEAAQESIAESLKRGVSVTKAIEVVDGEPSGFEFEVRLEVQLKRKKLKTT